jgi:hypothetical protein
MIERTARGCVGLRGVGELMDDQASEQERASAAARRVWTAPTINEIPVDETGRGSPNPPFS